MNSKERREVRYKRRKAKRDEKHRLVNEKYGQFENVFTFENLYSAYQKCCRGVGWKASTQRYRANSLLNINTAHKKLHSDKYKPGGFVEFDIIERGKKRHIKSIHISERVVQRCLCDTALIPLITRSFIYDSGACLERKGIDFALNRLTCHMQRHYRKHGTEGYALCFDFSKFFDRIPHDIVIQQIRKQVKCERIIKLAEDFIRDFGGDKGLGLGSQISQICALAFPNKLDHFIKEKLRIKNYARYMDDGYLIHHSKEYLQHCLEEIIKVCDSLGIVLNPRKTQIAKLSRGITFLKTRFNLTDTGKVIKRPNKKSITRMRRKLKTFKNWLDTGRFTMYDIRTSYKSWQGHIKRCNSFHVLKNMEAFYNQLFTPLDRGENFYMYEAQHGQRKFIYRLY